MQVDWAHFTPAASAAGGAMIGLAAGLLIMLMGRIAGISGILGGLVPPARGDTLWLVAFLAGLLAAPWLYPLAARLPDIRIDAGWPILVIAGLLVGAGTRLAAGCTSGHGVCGLSRLSPRSLVAVATFMATGFLTVFLSRHVLGL